jgi:hypothetical protein
MGIIEEQIAQIVQPNVLLDFRTSATGSKNLYPVSPFLNALQSVMMNVSGTHAWVNPKTDAEDSRPANGRGESGGTFTTRRASPSKD